MEEQDAAAQHSAEESPSDSSLLEDIHADLSAFVKSVRQAAKRKAETGQLAPASAAAIDRFSSRRKAAPRTKFGTALAHAEAPFKELHRDTDLIVAVRQLDDPEAKAEYFITHTAEEAVAKRNYTAAPWFYTAAEKAASVHTQSSLAQKEAREKARKKLLHALGPIYGRTPESVGTAHIPAPLRKHRVQHHALQECLGPASYAISKDAEESVSRRRAKHTWAVGFDKQKGREEQRQRQSEGAVAEVQAAAPLCCCHLEEKEKEKGKEKEGGRGRQLCRKHTMQQGQRDDSSSKRSREGAAAEAPAESSPSHGFQHSRAASPQRERISASVAASVAAAAAARGGQEGPLLVNWLVAAGLATSPLSSASLAQPHQQHADSSPATLCYSSPSCVESPPSLSSLSRSSPTLPSPLQSSPGKSLHRKARSPEEWQRLQRHYSASASESKFESKLDSSDCSIDELEEEEEEEEEAEEQEREKRWQGQSRAQRVISLYESKLQEQEEEEEDYDDEALQAECGGTLSHASEDGQRLQRALQHMSRSRYGRGRNRQAEEGKLDDSSMDEEQDDDEEEQEQQRLAAEEEQQQAMDKESYHLHRKAAQRQVSWPQQSSHHQQPAKAPLAALATPAEEEDSAAQQKAHSTVQRLKRYLRLLLAVTHERMAAAEASRQSSMDPVWRRAVKNVVFSKSPREPGAESTPGARGRSDGSRGRRSRSVSSSKQGRRNRSSSGGSRGRTSSGRSTGPLPLLPLDILQGAANAERRMRMVIALLDALPSFERAAEARESRELLQAGSEAGKGGQKEKEKEQAKEEAGALQGSDWLEAWRIGAELCLGRSTATKLLQHIKGSTMAEKQKLKQKGRQRRAGSAGVSDSDSDAAAPPSLAAARGGLTPLEPSRRFGRRWPVAWGPQQQAEEAAEELRQRRQRAASAGATERWYDSQLHKAYPTAELVQAVAAATGATAVTSAAGAAGQQKAENSSNAGVRPVQPLAKPPLPSTRAPAGQSLAASAAASIASLPLQPLPAGGIVPLDKAIGRGRVKLRRSGRKHRPYCRNADGRLQTVVIPFSATAKDKATAGLLPTGDEEQTPGPGAHETAAVAQFLKSLSNSKPVNVDLGKTTGREEARDPYGRKKKPALEYLQLLKRKLAAAEKQRRKALLRGAAGAATDGEVKDWEVEGERKGVSTSLPPASAAATADMASFQIPPDAWDAYLAKRGYGSDGMDRDALLSKAERQELTQEDPAMLLAEAIAAGAFEGDMLEVQVKDALPHRVNRAAKANSFARALRPLQQQEEKLLRLPASVFGDEELEQLLSAAEAGAGGQPGGGVLQLDSEKVDAFLRRKPSQGAADLLFSKRADEALTGGAGAAAAGGAGGTVSGGAAVRSRAGITLDDLLLLAGVDDGDGLPPLSLPAAAQRMLFAKAVAGEGLSGESERRLQGSLLQSGSVLKATAASNSRGADSTSGEATKRTAASSKGAARPRSAVDGQRAAAAARAEGGATAAAGAGEGDSDSEELGEDFALKFAAYAEMGMASLSSSKSVNKRYGRGTISTHGL